jgi:hypothetical protein
MDSKAVYIVGTAPFGFKITIAGRITRDEAMLALVESREALKRCKKPFGVLVDIRELEPLADEVQTIIDETQRLYRKSGLERSCVVLASAIMTMQFKRIARQTGVYAHERYVDASRDAHWERTALNWIIDAVDFDRNSRRPSAP